MTLALLGMFGRKTWPFIPLCCLFSQDGPYESCRKGDPYSLWHFCKGTWHSPSCCTCCTPAQPLLKMSAVQKGQPLLKILVTQRRHLAFLVQSQQWDRGWDLLYHPCSRSDELTEGTGRAMSSLTLAVCSHEHHSAELQRCGSGPEWEGWPALWIRYIAFQFQTNSAYL